MKNPLMSVEKFDTPFDVQRLRVIMTVEPSASRIDFSRPSASSSDALDASDVLCLALHLMTGFSMDASR